MNPHFNQKAGMLEVITGPMFSGKSEELLKRYRKFLYTKERVILIKPDYDTRGDINSIKARSGVNAEATRVKDSSTIINIAKEFDVIMIDEVQFFDDQIIPVIQELLKQSKKFIVSGLDTDYSGMPFTITAFLLAIADNVYKLKAVCLMCHNSANMTYRKTENKETNLIGDSEIYEARCRYCHAIRS